MLHNPQVLARESVTRVHDPLLGQIAMANVFPRCASAECTVGTPGPAVVGQHTDEVLGCDLGLSTEELGHLRNLGVTATPPPPVTRVNRLTHRQSKGTLSTEMAHVRRSQLFVPANRPKFIATAVNTGADAIILDLEDSVPSRQREAARIALSRAVRFLSKSHYVSVRVNKPFEVLIADLDAAISAKPVALVLPKVESALEVGIIDALVAERELQGGVAHGSTELQVLIETCLGLAKVLEIARSSPRIVSLTLGVEDLAKELEVEPGAPEVDLSWAHSRVLMAARAAGIAPYGLMNSLSNFTNLNALADDVRRSRAFGFVGAFCIHPAQVPVLNVGFAPSDEEIHHARQVVAALDKAKRNGAASTALDGRMIDVPVAERAQRILRRADLLKQQASSS
jgi:citrate lyase subunit beta/citryl-CoA lyase